MGPDSSRAGRRFFGIGLLEALVSGIILGFAAFFIKVIMSDVAMDFSFLFYLITNPLAWLAGAFGLAGFILLQKALHHREISIVTPLTSGLAILIPVLMALAFLGEAVSTLKWAGIVLILIGTAGLGG